MNSRRIANEAAAPASASPDVTKPSTRERSQPPMPSVTNSSETPMMNARESHE